MGGEGRLWRAAVAASHREQQGGPFEEVEGKTLAASSAASCRSAGEGLCAPVGAVALRSPYMVDHELPHTSDAVEEEAIGKLQIINNIPSIENGVG